MGEEIKGNGTMNTLEISFHNGIGEIADILVALGGRRRIEILKIISDGRNWTISKMAKEMNCGVANLSQQVAELEKAGLIIKQVAKSEANNTKIIRSVYKKIVINI